MLIPERVRDHLAATTGFTHIECLDVIDSTNRVVAERAAGGAPAGLVVTAERQTAGRGRLDRTWEAEPGAALLVSILLRPVDLAPPRWHLLTVAAGLAARQACVDVGGFTPDLKWPNDLMIGAGKLAGILAEATGGLAGGAAVAGGAVVVGMGLNVHAAPPPGAWADDAAGRRLDRAELLGRWLAGLDGYLGRWDLVATTYGEVCATVGRQVAVDLGGGRLVGRAESIDGEGRLVVRPDGGEPIAVSAGDVIHLRPAP